MDDGIFSPTTLPHTKSDASYPFLSGIRMDWTTYGEHGWRRSQPCQQDVDGLPIVSPGCAGSIGGDRYATHER